MTTIHDKLQAIESELNDQFFERREEVRALLVCLVARQHCLLVGAPGTAKSLLVRSLAERLGTKPFQWLLTKFSAPEEIFGPVSLTDLKAGRYKRITTDKLPEAEYAFIDEIWKANSAILNSMLSILNERIYHNNGGAVKVPLQFCVGASNEFPQGEELTALFDRFLVRIIVNPIADDANFAAMLVASGAPTNPTALTAAEVAAIQSWAEAVTIPDAVRVAVVDLRRALKAEGIVASDRRWRESLSLVKAAAALAGRAKAVIADLEVLRHVLWSDAGHRDKAMGIVLSVVNPHRKAAIEILDEARSVWGSTTAKGLGLDSATEIHEKLKKLKARAAKAARESGSGEFAEASEYISDKLREVGMAILGTEEE